MSDSINNELKKQEDLNQQPEEAFVPKKAYEDVSSDMHKYKGKARELEATLTEYQAKLEAIETAKLQEQGRWEEIAKKKDEQLKLLSSERNSEKNKFVDYHKKQAVIAELGGFKKSEYASFIDVSNVEVDDNGVVISSSLEAEVDRIRTNYPEIIKGRSSGILPSEAPQSTQASSSDYKNMSEADKAALRRKLIQG